MFLSNLIILKAELFDISRFIEDRMTHLPFK